MLPNQHSPQTDGVPSLGKAAVDGYKLGQGISRMLTMIPGIALGVISLFAMLFSSWGTCFTRERIGLVPLLYQAGLGAPLLALLTLTFQLEWARYTVLAWLLAVIVAYVVHLTRAAQRFVKPGREHVHTRSMGRPHALMRWMWRRLSDADTVEPIHVALYLEPALFGLAAYGVGMLEWTLFHHFGTPFSGVALLLLFTSAGIFVQALGVWLRDRWTLMRLLDDLDGQTAIESAVAKHPSAGAARETEGVATLEDGLFAEVRS